jgi:Methyltransferase domain
VTDGPFDPARFFDSHPRFVETSETGPWLDRLNARYAGLIHANRQLIKGARILDLASHDGRFAFAALQNGASHVIGIERKAQLVDRSRENFDFYGVPRDRYELIFGDMFDCIDQVGGCDIVFCFGILYHICDHMLLLSKIADVEPRALIVDTKLSEMPGSVVEIRSPLRGSPPPPGSELEGYPTKAALEAMFSSFGWTYEYFDWADSGLTDFQHMGDYRAGRRVSAVVACNEHEVSPEVRERSVRLVLERHNDDSPQFLTITLVARELGISPQTLRIWVRRVERDRHRGAHVPSPRTGGGHG